ncbi:hypothetical protein BG74_08380 [Sodalis-like endosymbiont of Proechinophthirus fluctus]|nr:hypothetical protein BG74_08380 [Sodalis-like endosymbiont of Proechinophthirus fluctus]
MISPVYPCIIEVDGRIVLEFIRRSHYYLPALKPLISMQGIAAQVYALVLLLVRVFTIFYPNKSRLRISYAKSSFIMKKRSVVVFHAAGITLLQRCYGDYHLKKILIQYTVGTQQRRSLALIYRPDHALYALNMSTLMQYLLNE